MTHLWPNSALQGILADVGNGQGESRKAPACLTPQGKLLLRDYTKPYHFHTYSQPQYSLQVPSLCLAKLSQIVMKHRPNILPGQCKMEAP